MTISLSLAKYSATVDQEATYAEQKQMQNLNPALTNTETVAVGQSALANWRCGSRG